MNLEFAIRALSLYGPIASAILLWILRPHPRKTGPSVLLALLWTLPTLLLLQRLNQQAGWWVFRTQGPTLRGLPVELFLGWACLWSAVPVLAFRRTWTATLAMVTLDLIVMPLCVPVVILGPHWLMGEAAAALIVLLPALLLAQWTREDHHLNLRVTLQVVIAGGIFLYLPPEIAFAIRGGTWHSHPALQLVPLLALPGLSAVQEFAQRGRGTPIPYDPPRSLVTTGLYRYIANPMQLSCMVVLFVWGYPLGGLWLASAGLIALAYSAGIARWDEHEDLAKRFGAPWLDYRSHVQDWLPRWTPYTPRPAQVYIAQTCGPCSELSRWLKARSPHGLEILPAESHPNSLKRMHYADAPYQADGVEALARTLEHINVAWAFLGAGMRLPIILPLLQRIADASGFGERNLGGETLCRPLKRSIGRKRPTGWFAALG